MGLGTAARNAASELGPALGELRPQMLCLEAELALCGGDLRIPLRGGDEGLVEAVATGGGFGMNGSEISRDRCYWIRASQKTLELGMMAVAACSSQEDALREEGFAPDSDESLWIEVLRMKRPESHW